MKTDETIKLLSDKEFLDKLFGYAYKRCSTSHEAEDLCSEIVMMLLKAIKQKAEVENFYAFAWTVAHRVYADYCKKRKITGDAIVGSEYSDDILNIQSNPIDDYINSEEEAEQMKQIMRGISFLSRIYRDVMVMYYLDEMKITAIASKLGISETAVKQRLFSARNTVKKEVGKMDNKNLSLKPVCLQFVGTGNPVGNDPREKAERVLSHNLVYLCKDEAKSAKELSELLGVPMPYIEDELKIQCRGLNGSYGLLRKLDNGKYISNILIVDADEYEEANQVYEKHLNTFCSCLKKVIAQSKDKMLAFPFMSRQDDPGFILWSLISSTVWNLQSQVNDIISNKYFKDDKAVKREFTCVAVAIRENGTLNQGFYGCDGIGANNICGYSKISISNIYSDRIEKHFGCGHNISTDKQLLMTIQSIGGLNITTLSDTDKEVAAKAIASGYLRKSGNILEPKILVFNEDNRSDFYNLLSDFNEDSNKIAEKIAEDMTLFMKKRIPKHLMGEYQNYNSLIASIRILHDVIEECIKEGLLKSPENRVCAEGTFMTVKK